jgi:GT2 family glycosyltransferase
VIIVDNGSVDGSQQKIEEYARRNFDVRSSFVGNNSCNQPIQIYEDSSRTQHGLILISNEDNYGFAEGNNIAIRVALERNPRYVLLLNNDVIVSSDFLSELVRMASTSDLIGFAGPKIYYYDYHGRKDIIGSAGAYVHLWSASVSHIGHKQIDRGQFNESKTVDFLAGTCLLVKKEVIDRVGLLKSDYFTYWEDVEWCLRGRNAGFKSVSVPTARIWHKEGVKKRERAPKAYYYFSRNMLLLVKEYAGTRQLVPFTLFFSIQIWKMMLVSLVYHDNPKEALFLLKGVMDGLKSRIM